MKMRLLSILVLGLVFSSCINNEYFGESKQANILTFAIEGEMSNKVDALIDWTDTGRVEIVVPESFDLSALKVTNVVISQLAHFNNSNPDTLTDFSSPVHLSVVAENEAIKKHWIVSVTKQKVEQAQLAFSSMKQWTPAFTPQGVAIVIKGQTGYWPGDGKENSPWQSSIQGNYYGAGLGIVDFSAHPMPIQPIAQYARLKTIAAGAAAVQMGTGMASGGLFTGTFVFNPSLVIGENKQPRKMMNVGVPFYSKPKGVKFEVRYKAGAQMVDGKLKVIQPGTGKPIVDSCDIMFALQNRLTDPNQWIRIATASLRTASIGDINSDNGFVEYEMDFVYGRPSAEQIAAKPYQQIGGTQGELFYYKFAKTGADWTVSDKPVAEVYASDPSAVDVDNIVVLISSSTYGDLFWAAIGSTLDIRNIELVY